MKISMVEKWWNKYNEYLVGIIYHHWKQSWPTHVVRSQTSWTLYWDLPTSSTRDQFTNRQRTQDLEMLCRQHLPFTSPWRQKAPAKSPSLTPQLQENLMDTKQPAHTRSHTDQYLPYDSHHLQSVKPNIVKCLYECAKHLVTKPSTISEEKKHLLSVLISIGYPSSFMQS